MFRAVFCAPILGVKPSHDFVFRSYRYTDVGRRIVFTLSPNTNEGGRLLYDAEHKVFQGEIEVTQRFLTCDSEIYMEGSTFRYFDRELFHSLAFLLTIRARNPLYAPVFCTRSTLSGEVNQYTGDIVQPLVSNAVGATFPCKLLVKADKSWIQRYWTTCIRLTKNKQFQDCMQALNSFSSIPYVNFGFLTTCTGIESLFRVSGYSKRSKLAQSASILLGRCDIIDEISEIYKFRNRIAHGEHVDSGVTEELSVRTFEIFCECLEKVVEAGEFPDPLS